MANFFDHVIVALRFEQCLFSSEAGKRKRYQMPNNIGDT
jgi:hypothetical protein